MLKHSKMRIALGQIYKGRMNWRKLEKFHNLAAQISRTFNPRSTCFWKSGHNAAKIRAEIFKTALFESYRQKSNYVIISEFAAGVNLPLIYQAINKARIDNCSCVEITNPKCRILLLLSITALEQIASKTNLGTLNSLTSEELENLLTISGIKAVTEFAVPDDQGLSIVLDGFHLPSEVNFVAVAHDNIENRSQDSYTSMLCRVFEAVSKARSSGRIAVYGAGSIAESIMPLIIDTVTMVVDSETSKQGADFLGFTIEAPEMLSKRVDDYDAIIITPLDHEPVVRSTIHNILGCERKIIVGFDGASTVEAEGFPGRNAKSAPADGGMTRLRIVPPELLPPRPKMTAERRLTKRGVLYVGYPCNIKCVFCYYAYTPIKEWHPLEECKRDATVFRQEFDNRWVDITGGEPTIYPHIFKLLKHCQEIDLTPSLITNTLALADEGKVKKFQDHGVYDFLASIHALTDNYDLVTGRKGAWLKMVQAIKNFGKLGMRWRTNCTMTALNMRQLKRIAEFSYSNGSRVINFISYNPFYKWSEKMNIDFQAKHSEIAPYLMEALDYCDSVGYETNVRYFPLCMMKGYEEKAYNFPQLSYDCHEWDFCSWYSEKTRNPARKLPIYLHTAAQSEEIFHFYVACINKLGGYYQNDKCQHCAMGLICDGFNHQYSRRFGVGEMKPYKGKIVRDPTYFINSQLKVLDE